MYFANTALEGIGLCLCNVEYSSLEGMSKISLCILLVPSFLHVFSMVLESSGHQKPHIVGHKDIEKELLKDTR